MRVALKHHPQPTGWLSLLKRGATQFVERLGLILHIGGLILLVYIYLHFAPDYVQFILPAPHKVIVALWEQDLALRIPNGIWIIQNIGLTLLDALSGFVVGNSIAIMLSIVMVFVPWLKPVVLRTSVWVKSVPFIVLIPMLMLVLGPNWKMRVALVSLATFFPTLINFFTGLHQVESDVMDYTQTLPGITPWATFRHVRIYYSLPMLFAALKTSASVVILSAVVVEWLTAGGGLGWLLYTFTTRYRMDLLVDLAIASAVLSLGFMRVVSTVEARIMQHIYGGTDVGRI